ncbi:hypothetical protein [Persicobacter psychrovividus]|uniref:Uncharacterized protein n=1 Tax=Persicobacter psychrovividus TaxID=387638 RepID=A0ABM7VIE8_9BACT|nr:hypothetical protein PEPS_30330 [Persicobacter psychrovividus]
MSNAQRTRFKLIGIKTEQFATFEEYLPKQDQSIELNAEIKQGVNSDDKIIAIVPKFTFSVNGHVFLSLSIVVQYLIAPDDWRSFVDADQNIVIIPKDLLTHLGFLAVSTCRGTLHAKTEGTPFNHFLLPLIDVNQLIKEDFVSALK